MTSTLKKSKYPGWETVKRKPQTWPPLWSWLMGTGSTRSILTWSTPPNLERRSPVWWSTPASINPSSQTGVRPNIFLTLLPLWRHIYGIKQKIWNLFCYYTCTAKQILYILIMCLCLQLFTIRAWFLYPTDPSLPEPERNKIAIGASGLVLGIIIAAAGLIYYKKKSSGQFRWEQIRLILIHIHVCIFINLLFLLCQGGSWYLTDYSQSDVTWFWLEQDLFGSLIESFWHNFHIQSPYTEIFTCVSL